MSDTFIVKVSHDIGKVSHEGRTWVWCSRKLIGNYANLDRSMMSGVVEIDNMMGLMETQMVE